MRSSPPLGRDTLAKLPEGIRWLFSGSHRREFEGSLGSACRLMPWRTAFVVLLAVILLLMRGRLGAIIAETGFEVRRISTDRYTHTLQALLCCVLLALPVPLLLGYACWLLGLAPEPTTWLRGLGRSLEITAWLAFWLVLLAAVCRKGGLGIAHFGWSSEFVVRFRRSLLWFGVLARLIRDHPKGTLVRWRHLWFPLLIGWPLVLVILASAGYMVTAFYLAVDILATSGVIFGGVILYWLVMRWFMIKERRLALAEAIAERRSRREQAKGGEEEPETGAIDGMTGTVTRIRMRTTTITNWDRQEYVVPNKTFVTGALLNWTLSNR